MNQQNSLNDNKVSLTVSDHANAERNSAETRAQTGPDRDGLDIDRISRAIRNPYNVLALAILLALGAGTLSLWPIVAALVLEACYLIFTVLWRQKADNPAAAVTAMPVELALSTSGRKLGSSRSRTGATKKYVDIARNETANDMNERYSRLEAKYRLIELQADASFPVMGELLSQMRCLLDKFMLFSATHDQYEELLQSIANEAKALPGAAQVSWVPDLQLVCSDGAPGDTSFEGWVQCRMKQAHDGFERELKEIAWSRRDVRDPAIDAKLEQRATTLLRRNRHTDKVGKTLLNLHCAIRLIEQGVDVISSELSTRCPEQVLSDARALVLQTQSLCRTIDELQQPGNSVEYFAA